MHSVVLCAHYREISGRLHSACSWSGSENTHQFELRFRWVLFLTGAPWENANIYIKWDCDKLPCALRRMSCGFCSDKFARAGLATSATTTRCPRQLNLVSFDTKQSGCGCITINRHAKYTLVIEYRYYIFWIHNYFRKNTYRSIENRTIHVYVPNINNVDRTFTKIFKIKVILNQIPVILKLLSKITGNAHKLRFFLNGITYYCNLWFSVFL